MNENNEKIIITAAEWILECLMCHNLYPLKRISCFKTAKLHFKENLKKNKKKKIY